MGPPTGVATPREIKLTHSWNFNETVEQPDTLDENVRDYDADSMIVRSTTLDIEKKRTTMPGSPQEDFVRQERKRISGWRSQ